MLQKLALETALSGSAPRVSEIRRQQSTGLEPGLGAPIPAAAIPGVVPPAGRYHPTQQYAQRGGGRGGSDFGAAVQGAPRTGYQPTRNYAGGRGGGFEGDASAAGGYEGGYQQRGGGAAGGYQQRSKPGFGSGAGYQPAGVPRDDGFGEGFGSQGSGRCGFLTILRKNITWPRQQQQLSERVQPHANSKMMCGGGCSNAYSLDAERGGRFDPCGTAGRM